MRFPLLMACTSIRASNLVDHKTMRSHVELECHSLQHVVLTKSPLGLTTTTWLHLLVWDLYRFIQFVFVGIFLITHLYFESSSLATERSNMSHYLSRI